jgi:hypothetical protein
MPLESPPLAPLGVGSLPGTDEFIERCERMRAWNYVVRAAAQAGMAPPVEAAGTARFGGARIWFTGDRARVHLLSEASLDQLPAIEAWLEERKLAALFDVLPIVACRPVTLALCGAGYRLVAWQPLLYQMLPTPTEAAHAGLEVHEVDGDNTEFRNAFIAGYELPEHEVEGAAPILEERWRAEGARRFVARIDGRAVAAATLVVFDGIARLANCATLPQARNRGAQAALIHARLRCASDAGATLAIADARQGGVSLRNLARAGFAVCAHITQWRKG